MALGDAVDARQINVERGADSFFALHHDVSGALLYDAIDGGESESGAFAFFFGGKEGLEDSRLCFFVHADAGVAYGQQNVVAGTNKGLAAAMGLSHDQVLGLDGELAAAGHRVFGVHYEIHQDLFQLSGVGSGVRRVGSQGGREFDSFADQGAEQTLHVLHNGVDVDNLEFEQLLAAESQEL